MVNVKLIHLRGPSPGGLVVTIRIFHQGQLLSKIKHHQPEARYRGRQADTLALKAKARSEARGGEGAKQKGALVTACFSSCGERRPKKSGITMFSR